MLKKITEDIFQTNMRDSPRERSAIGRVGKWLALAMIVGACGLLVGLALGLIF